MNKYAHIIALLLFFGLSANLSAQDKEEARYYYVGNIGDDLTIQMELSVEDKSVRGSYYNDKTGVPIPLVGEINLDDSKISLTTKSGSRKFNGTFTPVNGGLGTNIDGFYTEQDGLVKFPLKLAKVANYESILIKQLDKVEAEWSYPKLISKNEVIQKISSKLSDRMKPDIEVFQKSAKEAFMEDLISDRYLFNYNYSIEYYSENLVSFTGEIYSYTGGAHGNTYFVSSNYRIKDEDSNLLKLSDLFKKDSGYVKVLSDLIIADLMKQEAGWVVNGDIKSLKEDEIGPFALSPRGIQFAFAPYAVGPYSDGAFFVTIAFDDINNIIDQKGPLTEFIGATSEAQKE